MSGLVEILAGAALALGAFGVGAAWARRRAQAPLAAEIESRRRAERDAEAAHLIKSEILANVSHEIRTPMNGVLGMTDFLLTTELPAARRQQALEVIHTSAEGLLALIDDLLDFSKIEAGKLLFQGADFKLRDLVHRVVDLLRPQATEKGLELRLEIAPEMPDDLYGDPTRLRQVLLNLVGNAVKFTHEGEVSLRVEQGEAAHGSSRRPAAGETPADEDVVHVRFAVHDTGIGISPGDQARLFAPFAQADSTAAREFGGTGLGLVICKNLVEMMCGEIGFESTREVGSTFWFHLPLAPAREPVARAPVAADTSRPHASRDAVDTASFTILVVDDNAVNRRVAASQAEALGYRTRTATGGASALEALEERRFDIVLMDCQMPKLDGYETTRRLRRREQSIAQASEDTGRRTVVIGVTAHALKGQREQVLAAGMDDFLAKPYRVAQLGAVLERWLPASSEPQPPAVLGGLETEVDDDLRVKIAQDFLREGARDVEKIRQAFSAGDVHALEQGAHSLGGSASFLRADALDELCRELEDLARQGDLSGCEPRLQALHKEHKRLVRELEDLVRRADS